MNIHIFSLISIPHYSAYTLSVSSLYSITPSNVNTSNHSLYYMITQLMQFRMSITNPSTIQTVTKIRINKIRRKFQIIILKTTTNPIHSVAPHILAASHPFHQINSPSLAPSNYPSYFV